MEKKRIGTALLSYGMSGYVFHGPLLKATDSFDIKVVYQRSAHKKASHSHPVVTSLQEIFNNDDVELVIVNTPNNTHFEYTMKALEAGKHVIVEKPFTVTSSEACQLIDMAKRKNLILTVYQNRRWDGGFLTLQKILKDNLLGRVVEVEVHYDRYRNYVEPNTWKEEDIPGNGILYNLGSHMIDQVLVLLGAPEYVDARLGIQRTGGKVNDYYDIRMQYSNGINAIVKSSYLVREQGPSYRINGTEGSFVKYGIDPQEQDLKDGKIPGSKGWGTEAEALWGKLNTTIDGKHYEGPYETVPGNYLAFYENVYDAIRNKQPLAVKPEESALGIKVIEASIESNRLRKAIRI